MKRSTLALSIALTLTNAIYLNDVLAQQNQTTSQESTVEVIQITGSNIKKASLEEAQPLISISSEDIARSGATNLSELMRLVNQTRGGTGTFNTSQSGATSTSTPPGQAAVSLRGMGPSSTLTLVNGRRIAASSFASGTENFVDVNAIPLAAIERIDVLATGASAVYGADAVAGVINYILKKDFEGLELNAQYSQSQESADESELGLQLFYGMPLENGHFSVFADYFDRKPIRATSRPETAMPILQSSYSYLAKNTPNIYFNSAFSGNEIGNPNCSTELVTTEFGESICAYYGNEDDYLETPFESASVGFIHSVEIGKISWNTDFIFSTTSSTSFSSPSPINQIDDREGPFVSESVFNQFSDELLNIVNNDVWIDPFDTPAGQRLFGFRFDARFSDPRTVEVDTNAYRLVSQLSGFMGDWDWRTGLVISRSESEQVATAGIYNRFQYHAALAGELCSDGSIANYDSSSNTLACGSGTLLDFYNPFDSATAENLAILQVAQARPTRDGTSELYALDALITGDLLEFNGNVISAAFGAEVRKEKISDIPSPDARARAANDYLVDVFGFGSSLSEASRSQIGAFAEFLVPINDKLEFNFAGRFDDYDDFGSTFNPRVGFTFQANQKLVLRGSWSTAFRAPSLNQAGVQLRTTRADFDCGANQAVADLYCEGESGLRGNNVLELGNPNLKAEESESYNLGLAFFPSKDTEITIDYWAFEHEDLVDTNMTGVLARAIDDASLRHCGLVPQGEQGISFDPFLCDYTDANGNTVEDTGADLSQILQQWVIGEDPRFAELPLFRDHILLLDNTGTQELSGVDFNVFQAFSLDSGELEVDLQGTHYLSFDRNIPGSDEIEALEGTFAYPETVGNIGVFFVADDWFIGARAFYTSSYQDDIEDLRGRNIDELIDLGVLIDQDGTRDVKSWTTLDLSAGYYFEKLSVKLRIENLLDENAPIAYSSARGYDAFNHDPFGRRFTVSLDYRF
jgi:outer membrane receptor protein involved in Fe transport